MKIQSIACVCIASVLLQIGQAAEVKFEAYPNEIKANLTTEASMRCHISDSASLRGISSIAVTHNGVAVASFTPAATQPYAQGEIGNLEVKGAVTGVKSEDGYIELSWKEPSLMYLGDYTCAVTAEDDVGHRVVLTSDLKLTEVTPTVMDVIAEFKSKDLKHQSLIDAQAHELSNQKVEIDHLKHELVSQINGLTQVNNNQSTSISQLQTCRSPNVAFSAAIETGANAAHMVSFAINQVMKFDKVLTNENNAYNSRTGLFTVNTPGVYLVTVNIMTFNKKSICIALQKNQAEVTSIYASDRDNSDGASMSAVLRLSVGDTMRVWTLCASDFFQSSSYAHANIFNAVLIQSNGC